MCWKTSCGSARNAGRSSRRIRSIVTWRVGVAERHRRSMRAGGGEIRRVDVARRLLRQQAGRAPRAGRRPRAAMRLRRESMEIVLVGSLGSGESEPMTLLRNRAGRLWQQASRERARSSRARDRSPRSTSRPSRSSDSRSPGSPTLPSASAGSPAASAIQRRPRGFGLAAIGPALRRDRALARVCRRARDRVDRSMISVTAGSRLQRRRCSRPAGPSSPRRPLQPVRVPPASCGSALRDGGHLRMSAGERRRRRHRRAGRVADAAAVEALAAGRWASCGRPGATRLRSGLAAHSSGDGSASQTALSSRPAMRMLGHRSRPQPAPSDRPSRRRRPARLVRPPSPRSLPWRAPAGRDRRRPLPRLAVARSCCSRRPSRR